jgi:phage gp29-like protein
LAEILEAAERGELGAQSDLFEDMEEKDGHIFAEIDKRKRAILSLDWSVEPPPNPSAAEHYATDLARDFLSSFADLEGALFDLTDAYGKGFSCLEIEWRLQDRHWLPAALHYRPQKWFFTPMADRAALRLRDLSPAGQALQSFGWVLHIHRARSGYLGRAGLHRTLAWPYLFKNYAVRDLAEFLEIYGLPLRLGHYPVGATDDEKFALLRAVAGIGHDAAGIIPEGMSIEFKEAAQGTKDPFEFMMDWCERTISKAVLGATLTSQTERGRGTYALGNVHLEIFRDLIRSDARQMQRTISRELLWPITLLNVGGVSDPSRAPRFLFDTRAHDDILLYAEALPKLIEAGLPVPLSWAQDKLRIPVAKPGEPLMGGLLQDAAPGGTLQPET